MLRFLDIKDEMEGNKVTVLISAPDLSVLPLNNI
jgi:hypothetical protein